MGSDETSEVAVLGSYRRLVGNSEYRASSLSTG